MKKQILYVFLTLTFILSCISSQAMNVQDLNKKLIDTVLDKNLSEIQQIQILSKLLKQGADINSRFYGQDIVVHGAGNIKTGTALIEASRLGLKHVVGFLLSNPNININAQNDDGHTALMKTAINRGNKPEFVAIAKNLLDHNANIYIKSRRGETILHYAAFYNQTDLIDLILKTANQKSSETFDKFINEIDNMKDNALDIAIKNYLIYKYYDYNICKKLLEEGIDYSIAYKIACDNAKDYPNDHETVKMFNFLITWKPEVKKQISEGLASNITVKDLINIITDYTVNF